MDLGKDSSLPTLNTVPSHYGDEGTRVPASDYGEFEVINGINSSRHPCKQLEGRLREALYFVSSLFVLGGTRFAMDDVPAASNLDHQVGQDFAKD